MEQQCMHLCYQTELERMHLPRGTDGQYDTFMHSVFVQKLS